MPDSEHIFKLYLLGSFIFVVVVVFFICHNSRLNGFNFNNIVLWLEQFYSCMLSQRDYECKWAWK